MRRLPLLMASAAGGLAVFLACLGAVANGALAPGDRQALRLAGDLHAAALVSVARVLTWLGAAPVAWSLVALAAAWLVTREQRLEAGVLLAGLVVTVVLVHVVKVAVDRARPPHPLTATHDASFPSGHTAYATALVAAAVAVARRYRGERRVAIVVTAVTAAVVVALTRMYLRAHYLSDVLGGAGLATAVFALCGAVALTVGVVRHNGAR